MFSIRSHRPTRFGDDFLRDHALGALEELTQECRYRQPPRTIAVRFVLAYLAAGADDREPFDEFWKALVDDSMWRFGKADQALIGICKRLGIERDHARMMATWKRLFAREEAARWPD